MLRTHSFDIAVVRIVFVVWRNRASRQNRFLFSPKLRATVLEHASAICKIEHIDVRELSAISCLLTIYYPISNSNTTICFLFSSLRPKTLHLLKPLNKICVSGNYSVVAKFGYEQQSFSVINDFSYTKLFPQTFQL